MKTMAKFHNLIAWQKARILTQKIYDVSTRGKFATDYGLRDQIQRAAVSVMSNIAEGFGRGAPRQFRQFLDISWASATEVQSLLYVALDLNYIDTTEFHRLINLTEEVISIIAGLKRSLKP